MNTPDLIPFADARKESGDSDVALFGYGLEFGKPLRFFVIVPERGAAYQVPRKALQHFQAGATEYLATNLREHWNGQPLAEYLILKDRLFVLADDWIRRVADAEELAQSIERISVPLRLGFRPVQEVASTIARAVLGITDDAEDLSSRVTQPARRFHQEVGDWLSLILRLVNEGTLTLYDQGGMSHSGPFNEGFLASAELAVASPLFVLPPSADRTYPRRIWFEVFSPGHSLRTVLSADGAATTAWYPDEAQPDASCRDDLPQKAPPVASGIGIESSWTLVPAKRANDLRNAYYQYAKACQRAGWSAPPSAMDCLREWAKQAPFGLEIDEQKHKIKFHTSKSESPKVVGASYLTARIKEWTIKG